ncbi:MAG: hypothetical protein WB523_08965 [Candidatus Sulfotelmatobacter sp.]
MSHKSSEEMMSLLQELALLKKLDNEDEGSVVQSVETQARQKRRNEIADQIKALSETAG